jgi:ABC-2 type transport system ATP-binding protein
LLNVAAGIQTPQCGQVLLDGVAVRSRRELFRRVAWMPQHIQPIAGLTVDEQVRLSAWSAGVSRKAAPGLARTAIEAAMLGELSGRRVRDLSGGELRRVGFAEALARGADILLLDEPTAGLDDDSIAAMLTALGEAEIPLAIATHEPATFAPLGRLDIVAMSDVDQVLVH